MPRMRPSKIADTEVVPSSEVLKLVVGGSKMKVYTVCGDGGGEVIAIA